MATIFYSKLKDGEERRGDETMRSLSGAIRGKGIYLIGLGYPFIGRFPLAHMISAQFCKEQQVLYILYSSQRCGVCDNAMRYTKLEK